MRRDDTGKKYFEYIKKAKEEFEQILNRHPELALLSAREMEVFEQLLTDKTLAQIAQDLYISHSTVHFHCKNIYRKLEISSRRQFIIQYKDLC